VNYSHISSSSLNLSNTDGTDGSEQLPTNERAHLETFSENAVGMFPPSNLDDL
jgi:hypothetical protein